MTDKQVIETELECVKRQQCDRDCGKCDLVMDSEEIIEAYEHSIELLDAEEQGLLVRLPCKVGTPCYKVWQVGDETGIVPWEFDYDDILDFGYSVFLTREETEAALKGGLTNV